MKKLFLFLISAVGYLTAQAVDYSYVIIKHKDGTESSFKSAGLHITVAEEQLLVNSSEGSTTFKISDLLSMAFSAEPAYIGSMTTDEESIIDIFTTDGIYLGRAKSAQNVKEIVPSEGVYVFKSNNGIEKVFIAK